MPRPQEAGRQQQQQRQRQRQGRLPHKPECKYYQGDPPANTAIFDIRSQQEEAEAEARHTRLQLQRLPALTIRRQLQVQWGPTVSLPQPGEPVSPGPAPGHNVCFVEVRHANVRAAPPAPAATPVSGRTLVVQKPAKARSRQQLPPPSLPIKQVDVSPLRELPPEQAPPHAAPQPTPLAPPSPRQQSPSRPRKRSPLRQRTSSAKQKPSPSGRLGGHISSEVTRGQPLPVRHAPVRHASPRGSREAVGSRAAAAPTPTLSSRPRATIPPPPRRSATRRGSPTRRVTPAGTATTCSSARRLPTPRQAPAKVNITMTSLPSSVQGGLTHGTPSEALFRELSAAAEARLVATVPRPDLAAADDSADGPPEVEPEVNPFREMSVADRQVLALLGEADADGGTDADTGLWSTTQHIRRQQEAAEIEDRVLDLIGARVVAGLLNMDRKQERDNWREHHMQQSPQSNEVDEVGEHRVLGEGISLEETEIRTPVNYDDYLGQEAAGDEEGYSGSENGGSADGGSLNYEDDFEDDEEEANYQETTPAVGNKGEEEPKDMKSTSIPDIQVDGESLKLEKSEQGTHEVEVTSEHPSSSPEPAASSPPSPQRFGTVRIRSRRTGGITTISIPSPSIRLPTPVSSPERSRSRSQPAAAQTQTRRIATPERSPSPQRDEGASTGRVPTPPPSPDHAKGRITLYKWRSAIEAPSVLALTPPVSPPAAPPDSFSFTPPEATSPRRSPPLPVPTTAARPLRVDTGQQTTAEAPVARACRSRHLGSSLTSSGSLTYSSSISSNLQLQSQDSLSWGEVRPPPNVSSSVDMQLSPGEVPPAWVCSSLSEGEVAIGHRCSKVPSTLREGMAAPDRPAGTSTVAVDRPEKRVTQKDLSEGEVSEGQVATVILCGMPEDTDGTSASDTS